MSDRQYPRADDMSLIARLKLVGKLHGRGFSASRIATELDYDVRTAKKDIATIVDRYREFEDLDVYLKDVTARTGEQLTKLNEQEAILWKQLDWSTEWVPQVDGFGAAIYEFDSDGNKKSSPLMEPRKPGVVPQLIGQIQSINKQQAEMLGLLNKNVDITIKLQKSEKVQLVMLEAIKETDETVYKALIRRMRAEMAAIERPGEQLALNGGSGRSLDEVIEAKYTVVDA